MPAALKLLVLKPQLNRFIKNGSLYQKNDISASFVVKRKLCENSEEGLAFINGLKDDTLETIHQKIYDEIYKTRKGSGGDAVDSINIFRTLPSLFYIILVQRFLNNWTRCQI